MFKASHVLFFFVLFPWVAMLPGWWMAQRHQAASLWWLGLPYAGGALWVLLVLAGWGPQSLSNVVELFVVELVAVLAVYLNWFVLSRHVPLSRFATGLTWIILVGTVVLLRMLMPTLPE